ncbi:uncharacterized protein LOC123673583 [Harmonia axyridis]|uniref:uncharacterized protein LOC123673583 n=1 Tax=Harmonia axyridis TaxID=115357 RepID=UPI001E2751B7|nr:uncharacterized protein LOC123673583 [Harmonia axyridis]
MESKDYENVCELLDKLYLDTLYLMEEEIKVNINMEKAMIEGENNLAKCRYIMGPNSVSAMNIPMNPEETISPSMLVKGSPNDLFPEVNSYQLHSVEDSKDNVSNPVKWFGFFTQQNLLNSQKFYKHSLQWAIQAVTIQNELKYLMKKCRVLRLVKASLAETEK